ncbi:MAG: TIGR04084 family radical SAM/SPASM domain-containing protein [Candidatus Hodarchaeota archaeon]
MIYNIILTHECNKNCRYCLNQESEIAFPRRISYSMDDLKKFISKDEHPMLAYYGGEPLVAMDLMERIMDEIPAERHIIQTNAHFLNKVKDKYLFKFYTILASIDGRKETTNYYRGEGTHDLVVENCRELRKRGFKGEITARMCVSEHTDLYKDVSYLRDLLDEEGDPLFDGVHWQNDMQFGVREDWRDLDGWLQGSYYPGIDRLVQEWVDGMGKNSSVRLIYPFVGLVKTMLDGIPAKLYCGCGHFNNNICTDGTITACPVSSDFYPVFEMGNIFDNHPKDLFDAMFVGDPCPSCEIYSICGGRCLYANKLKPWGEEGYKKTCETIFYLVNSLKKKLPRIKEMLEEGTIKIKQFEYFQYNGCEIVP